jgi:hypothetical protein
MKDNDLNVDEDGYGDKKPDKSKEKINYKNELPSDANSERFEDTDSKNKE